jgi:hypothetical protein
MNNNSSRSPIGKGQLIQSPLHTVNFSYFEKELRDEWLQEFNSENQERRTGFSKYL